MQRVSENSGWHLVSMTGLGQSRRNNETVSIEATVKSVNHRGIDIKFRLAKELLFLEIDLAAIIADTIGRGRIDVQISLEFSRANWELNFAEDKVLALLKKLSVLKEKFPDLVSPLSIKDVLHVPGMIKDSDSPQATEAIKVLVIDAMREALTDLKEARMHEGAILQANIKEMLATCSSCITAIEQLAYADIGYRFSRYKNRIDELFHEYSINEDRLYQELALLAERSDFKEELDRLKAHIDHFSSICINNGAKGRKLDFLCQEMLRESNTLLSKAFGHEVIRKAIDLKAEVERIREQVQNIE